VVIGSPAAAYLLAQGHGNSDACDRRTQRRPRPARTSVSSLDLVATREVNQHPEIGLDVAVVKEGGALILRDGVPMVPVPPPDDFTLLWSQQEGATRLVARERYIHGLMRFTTPS
jgi:hypothetical protein